MRKFPRSTCLHLNNVNSFRALVLLLVLPMFAGRAAAGELTVSPTTIAFGTVNVGTSQSKSVTVTNTGNSTIKVSNVAVYGAGFSLKGLTIPLILSAHESSSFN